MTDEVMTPTALGRRWWLLVGVAAVLVAAGAFLVPRLRPHVFSGQVLQSPGPAPDLEGLVLNTGEPARLADFAGRVVVLYFGFTHCPDVCPTTLSALARAVAGLGPEGDDVQVLMVSVDPERDTPRLLGEYVASFDHRFLGVTGTGEAVDRVAALYGIYYAKVSDPSMADGYTVDHTASVMVIDRDGFLRVVYPPGVTPAQLTPDLRELVG
jgi:protein SCO1/2